MFVPLIPLLSFLTPAILAADLPLGNYFIQNLGIATDPSSQKQIYHDGGGGAYQNGYHVQVFADSTLDLNGDGMVHNSVAYAGYVSLMRCPTMLSWTLTSVFSESKMTLLTSIHLAWAVLQTPPPSRQLHLDHRATRPIYPPLPSGC